MNDTSPTNKPDGADAPAFAVLGQYIKDLSFEAPNSPTIFPKLQSAQPDLSMGIDLQAEALEGQQGVYEACLTINAEMKVGSDIGFILELKYAGSFAINVPEEHLGPMLMIECPRFLFPFARAIVSEITRDGGFMPLALQPVDFAQLYEHNKANQAAGGNASAADSGDSAKV